jgi:DNA mismatch repair protein MutH
MSPAELPYNGKSREDILRHARLLIGTSLADFYPETVFTGHSGKGGFGNYIEKYHFKYEPNSVSEPDFPDAGIELKTSPLRKNRRGHWRSKERIVLGLIDYRGIVAEIFDGSAFLKKNHHLLIIFYGHDADASLQKLVVHLVGDWKFPDNDFSIIKKDWEKIQQKVSAGEAHLLSEGDTVYLSACTKGASAKSVRNQPHSDKKAKQRAFALKSRYVNFIIEAFESGGRPAGNISPIFAPNEGMGLESVGFDKLVVSRFDRYVGMSPRAIAKERSLKINFKAKSAFANLTKGVLVGQFKTEVAEFLKAGITVRTIRIDCEGKPQQAVSFPAFEYCELVEEEWEDSNLLADCSKLFFVVYQCNDKNFDDEKLRLKGAFFWNTSVEDLDSARETWERTRELIKNGGIVRSVSGRRRQTNFPGAKKNRVVHVRPHGTTIADVYPLPVPDGVTGASEYTKHSFWLNQKYLRKAIAKSLPD